MAGEINVNSIARRLTAKQFRDWEIYHGLEPFGEFRADYRAAQITQMVHNVAVEKRQQKKLEEFLLHWEQKETDAPKQTPDDQLKMMQMMFGILSTELPPPLMN